MLLTDDGDGVLLYRSWHLIPGLLNVLQHGWVESRGGEGLDRRRGVLSSDLHGDIPVLVEVDSSGNPQLEEIFSVLSVLRDVDLLGVPFGVLVGPGLELIGAVSAHVTLLSTPVAPHWLRTVRHLVTFLLAPPADLWLRTLGGHVTLLSAVATLGWLRALGHHVTLLLAPAACLGLGALLGKVAFLSTPPAATISSSPSSLLASLNLSLLTSVVWAPAVIRHDQF